MKPSVFLFPFSLIYGAIVVFRNWFFDIGILSSASVGVPVISVGNITAGGTGKTPIVSDIARILLGGGKKVAVISRGYGRESRGTIVVSDGKNILSTVEDSGDESSMLARRFGKLIIIVDEDRVRGARKAVNDLKAEVIILDDGFQHRYLNRSIDIVLMDANNSPFHTMMIPAGYRREPLSGLDRADAVVVTKVKDGSSVQSIVTERKVQQIQHKFTSSIFITGLRNIGNGKIETIEILKGHSVVAFCGIAQPDSFRDTVLSLNATIKGFFGFNDHHLFTNAEMDKILISSKDHAVDYIVTTEKDAVRLHKFVHLFDSIPLLAVQLDTRVEQETEWKKFILGVVA